MEKIIWVIGSNRTEMIETQRRINYTGSMRAMCLLSLEAVRKAVGEQETGSPSRISTPSLIMLDYEEAVSNAFEGLRLIKKQGSLAGVPVFFMVKNRTEGLDEECYNMGAMVVLTKPLSEAGIVRVERTAWQYEVTKNYEKMIQKQAGDLLAAKEIHRLNEQLQSRNELLHQIFGRYFSDKVVDAILKQPKGAVIGGEKKELTIMMADLRGFTSLSETLEPEIMTDVLNVFFEKMLDVILDCRGIIIEFLGDAILAVFGVTAEQTDQTADAICAGILMQNKMQEVNDYNIKKGYPVLEMGIGIHRGEVFIGNVGSEKMMRYNVIGGAVNECSRIEGYSVGGQVLASRETVDLSEEAVEVVQEIVVAAKGLGKPIVVCEVNAIRGSRACRLEFMDNGKMITLAENIIFHMYPIEDKFIMNHSIKGRLLQLSKKEAKVELLSINENIPLYSDLEICAVAAEGKELFAKVYAKVVRKQERVLWLHFTRDNKEFQQFIKSI